MTTTTLGKEKLMTKREYLTSLGFLVGARGRFKREQLEALKKAEAEGKTFTK